MSFLGVRVPHIYISDNLVQIKAMCLVNVQTFRSQCLASNRVLSVPQIDLSVCTDRKMVNLYAYLRNITKKSRFYRADMQIKK
jgi:hypothetical protein